MRLKILSIANAKGWYRIRGTRETHEIEKIACWAVIATRHKGKTRDHKVVGLLPSDLGRPDYGYGYLTDEVAGYAHKSELVDGFVDAGAYKRLKWAELEDETGEDKRKKAKQSSKKAKTKAKKTSKKVKARAKRKSAADKVSKTAGKTVRKTTRKVVKAVSPKKNGSLKDAVSSVGDRDWLGKQELA